MNTTAAGQGGGAAFDMGRFHQVFFEEAAEHLASLENLLVAVDVDAPEPDELNAIFRAAHSVKGGSGTFGFTEMTEVTHELESLLDRVRHNELALTAEMVDVLLAANDLLRAQLAHYRGESPPPELPVADMCERIRACMARSAAAIVPAAPMAPPAAPIADAAARIERDLVLTFAAPSDAHSDLAGLLDELRALGSVDALPSDDAAIVRVRVVTGADDEALRSAFGFSIDPATVAIEPHAAPAAPAEDLGYGFFDDAPGTPLVSAPAPAEDPGFGLFEPSSAAPTAPVAAPATAAHRAAPAARVASGAGRVEPSDASIRVGVGKVDELVNLVGELVITQAMLAQTAATVDPVLHERLLGGLAQLERNTRDLQQSVMSVRMMPIADVFNRFPRVVRDLAGKLGKQVELKLEGEGTELDKGIIEKLADPLTHLIRNSLDHGIESVADRVAAGKTAKGTISLRAFHRAGNIVIEVSDDGAGLDRARILNKATERGLPVRDDMTDDEVWQLIFEPGFSTATVVTDVSGRGVGMDVVRRNISALGGRVEIESALGVGLRVSIRLPLTLAILDGMSVGVSNETFIIPLNHVVESMQVATSAVHAVNGSAQLIEVRGEYVPVVALQQVFALAPTREEGNDGVMVIIEADGNTIALLVDELLGQHQVVIKSLEQNYRKVPGVSGATIMGDGRVAMILDVPALVQAGRH